MKDLVEKVARAIENEIAKRKGTFDSRDLSCASIRAVLSHFSEPGNVTDGMVSEHSAWDAVPSNPMPSMQSVWDNDTRYRIASAMRAALSELQAKEAGE